MTLSRRFSPSWDWTRRRIAGRGNGGADLGSLQRAPPRHKTGAAQVLEHINTVTSAEANLDAGGGGRVVQCLGALDDSINAPLTVRE